MAKIHLSLLCLSILLVSVLQSVESRSHLTRKLVRRDAREMDDASYDAFADESSKDDDLFQGDEDDEEDDEGPDEDTGEPTQLFTSPTNISANPGETVRLPCKFSPLKKDDTLEWIKRKDILLYIRNEQILKNSKYELADDYSLIIKNVQKPEIDSYSCLLLGTGMNVTHNLDLFTEPNVIQILPNETSRHILQDKSVTIECRAVGNPKPVVIWSFKGHRIETNDNVHIGDQAIHIKNIKREHSGTYQCLADNKIGNPSHRSIDIRVLYPPKVHVKKSVINTGEEYDATLLCTIFSDPKSNIAWFKGDEEIKNSGKYHINREHKDVRDEHNAAHSSLKISNVVADDFGTYRCVGRNQFGEGVGHVNLVKVPGRALWIGGHQDVGDSNPILKWTVDSVQPLMEVEIKYSKINEAKPEEEIIDWKIEHPKISDPVGNKYTISHVIEGLKPGKYVAHLRTKNEHGWSDISDRHTFDGDYTSNEIYPAERSVEAPVAEIVDKSGGVASRVSCAITLLSFFLVRIL